MGYYQLFVCFPDCYMESTTGTSTPSFTNNYIGLNEFVVHFSEEVSTFFNERIGKDEFLRICKKSCQAPP